MEMTDVTMCGRKLYELSEKTLNLSNETESTLLQAVINWVYEKKMEIYFIRLFESNIDPSVDEYCETITAVSN